MRFNRSQNPGYNLGVLCLPRRQCRFLCRSSGLSYMIVPKAFPFHEHLELKLPSSIIFARKADTEVFKSLFGSHEEQSKLTRNKIAQKNSNVPETEQQEKKQSSEPGIKATNQDGLQQHNTNQNQSNEPESQDEPRRRHDVDTDRRSKSVSLLAHKETAQEK